MSTAAAAEEDEEEEENAVARDGGFERADYGCAYINLSPRCLDESTLQEPL